jgi:hypothetical protein
MQIILRKECGMPRVINTIALLFLTWLLLDALNAPDAIINFLIIGAIPGSSQTISPSMMLAIMTTIGGIITFELLARRFDVVRQIRYHFINLTKKHNRLPKRRFGRA